MIKMGFKTLFWLQMSKATDLGTVYVLTGEVSCLKKSSVVILYTFLINANIDFIKHLLAYYICSQK